MRYQKVKKIQNTMIRADRFTKVENVLKSVTYSNDANIICLCFATLGVYENTFGGTQNSWVAHLVVRHA